jgi:hypothetical protein
MGLIGLWLIGFMTAAAPSAAPAASSASPRGAVPAVGARR